MLRFPNPGSTIENFVGVYAAAFRRLNGTVVSLDDIVQAVVAANLATSSGYVGNEAISRSTREDRSRDPLYNQLKMYAELFRTMGWLHSTAEDALKFTFTLLGAQVVAAGRDFQPILDECALGVVYPNPILRNLGDFDLRPFASILRVMDACGGYLSRDEMIIGPLSAATDRSSESIDAVVRLIRGSRKSSAALQASLDSLAKSRRAQVNTLQNYTRWPIAMMRDSGWITQASATFANGRKYQVWTLTEKGKALAARVGSSLDLRADDVARLAPVEREGLALLSHFRMLQLAGFDTSGVQDQVSQAAAKAGPALQRLSSDGTNILFSPFQSLSLPECARIFTSGTPTGASASAGTAAGAESSGRDDRSHLFVPATFVERSGDVPSGADALRRELVELLRREGSVAAAASAFAEAHAGDTQVGFYPLVTNLFRLMGFRSEHSRAGVNYQRWDAAVWIDDLAIPVEIKSPTEELFLSTKAVRQALENKVVLLARGGLPTSREITSLVVGNRLPNERGDMSNLIDNVFAAFNLRLGVLDLTTLAHLALSSIHEGRTIDPAQLRNLRGFLNV